MLAPKDMREQAMQTKHLIAASLALMATACAHQVGSNPRAVDAENEDYRISVEIPLQEMHLKDAAILKVDELLNERTHFEADDFQLDEVVLIGRGEGDDGNAELLVLEWRSGQFVVPAGTADEWYEVRIPAPTEDIQGAWLLDITGDVTVDMLVAVLAPRPPLVEVARTTAHRTRSVYRNVAPLPTAYHTHWIYEPSRYYVYHNYDIWAYRYFIGPWSYRYYDLGFRPHRFHYGPLYRPHRSRSWRHRYYQDERRGEAQVAERRRVDPQLVKLRRNHPRLRAPQGQSEERRGERPSNAQRRYQEAKRSNQRLRAFHRAETAPQSGTSARRSAETARGERERRTATVDRLPNRGVSAREPRREYRSLERRQEAEPRIRTSGSRAAPVSSARTASSRARPARDASSVRTARRQAAVSSEAPPLRNQRPQYNQRSLRSQRQFQRAPATGASAANARAARAPVATPQRQRAQRQVARPAAPRQVQAERPASQRGNVRTRSFERRPQHQAAAPRATPPRSTAPQRAAPRSNAPRSAPSEMRRSTSSERPSNGNARTRVFERR